MQIVIISNSADFTKDLGKKLSRFLTKGSIILFTGELGGGKTTFISGIAAGLGFRKDLSSPSFTILNEYRIGGRMKLIHADLYRLEDIDELNDTGLNDYIYDGFSIICVEWGDRIRDHIKYFYK
jgi:tRNA threonylcarbamoyladenosine biosynthesis protein TsaE